MLAPVLLCSSAFWSQYQDEVIDAAPGIEVVQFTTGQRVSHDDIARLTIAFCSVDLYPDGLAGFYRVCLDAPRLQWMQIQNVGIDHPVFGMLLAKGLRMTTASGTSAIPIAQHVIMFLLALARGLPESMAAQQRHEWQPRELDD